MNWTGPMALSNALSMVLHRVHFCDQYNIAWFTSLRSQIVTWNRSRRRKIYGIFPSNQGQNKLPIEVNFEWIPFISRQTVLYIPTLNMIYYIKLIKPNICLASNMCLASVILFPEPKTTLNSSPPLQKQNSKPFL